MAFQKGMIPSGSPPNGHFMRLQEWLPVCLGVEASWAWSQCLARAAYVLDSAVGSMDRGDAAWAILCVRIRWSS